MSLKTKKKARTSFGATAPPFIDYLKGILRRYPDGGQILKELIQNADDAEATEVVFIHDERSYGTNSLWTEELGKYQGPALYAYNNAAFTDEDWGGIQRAGRSVKATDPNKVGSFGIGFNSVYHITDVPSVFSSVHLGLLDPQEKIFGEKEGGFQWSLDDPEHREALMDMHDQFQPFRDIVALVSEHEWSNIVQDDQHFGGTIFRFPLRKEASEISDNLYDSDKVVELFDSFIADAELSLVFLKNVTSVTLIHVGAQGAVTPRLKLTATDPPADSVPVLEENSIIQGLTRFKVITHHGDVHMESKWLMTTCTMKEGNVESLDLLAKKLNFLPRVDLAFPCGQGKGACDGRLCCFLPLPNNESNKTGLPVYVNACFGLTDNRREIKWQEEDQKRDEHALWNELLIQEVLPQAYLMIIQDAVGLAQRSDHTVPDVYDLWPDIDQLRHKDKWYAIALVVLAELFKRNVPVLSLAKDKRKFIPLTDAVLPCNGPTSLEVLAAIKRTLVSCGESLVTLPAHVSTAIAEAYPSPGTLKGVTPAFIRDTLRRIDMQSISREDRLCLLEFVLSDKKYGKLEGLQLLPHDDGSFRAFTEKVEDRTLIDSSKFPRTLLPWCKHLFIPDDLNPDCISHLNEMAKQSLYKIINIAAQDVAEYTRLYLPQDWKKTSTGIVTWDVTGGGQHPSLDWLEEFWGFLNTNFKELSGFTGIPLIPVCSPSCDQVGSLAKLQRYPTLILHTRKQTSLPDRVAQLVNKAGGTVVKERKWLQHVDLESYVLCPSPMSVMKVLANLDTQHVVTALEAAPHVEREELKDYLARLDSLTSQENELFSKLPLFRTMKGVFTVARYKQAVPIISGLAIPSELPDSVVQCASNADRSLLQLLKVKFLNTGEAANLLVEGAEKKSCSKEDREKIMTWILQHGNILFPQCQTLKLRCRNLSFIDLKGELKKVSSFLDPRIESFKILFESDAFPPLIYTDSLQKLESLTGLGLLTKEEEVSPQYLLRAAMQVDTMPFNSKEAQKKAQALLKMLDANNLLAQFSLEQIENLKRLKWVPCDNPGDDGSEVICLFRPNEIRHSLYKDIVGHVMPLMGNLKDRVSIQLGFKSRPPPEKVIENLTALRSNAEKKADADTDADFIKKLHSIYRHMQEFTWEFEPMLNKDMRWLWCRDQFVSSKDVILDYPPSLDLSSYIRKVPHEFRPYKKLLRCVGLRTLNSDTEIIGILHSIHRNIEERDESRASPSEVEVSIEILNWLWRMKKSVKGDIPVPVILEGEHYTLKAGSTAVFCDVSKSGLKELNYSEEERIHVLHEEIPKAVAEWLNIPFLSTFLLDPELVGIEQCGQSEPITTRIKNILKEYDEESDVFKELIQNAEDAGAEACKFLMDFRAHNNSPESLIDPDMTLCQGPCLWAFNNEKFKAEDWANIVRVGAASKENKVEKIGKFGLGFNTVYHLTDVPSILSGNKLLILDPNVTHLKKHIKNKANPGIKLDLSQKRLFHWFAGQFGPYEGIFDCNFSQSPPEPYPGTLIKLPFRTKQEALTSEISKKVHHQHSIEALQQHFIDNSKTHLLFLKKVNKLSLHCISNNGSTPPKDGEIETVLDVTKTTVRTIPDGTCLSEQREAEKILMKLNTTCKGVIDHSTVSIVEITSQQGVSTEVQFWLLYNCFGTKEALKMSLQENKQTKFWFPLGGVALPLQKAPKSGKLAPLETDLVGQAFCFLPLSIQTGLPVNVNGTFAVTSNRKALWQSGVKHDWNKALLQDPLVAAYITALTTLKKLCQDDKLEDYLYHTFWPDRMKVKETFSPLVDAFYATIANPLVCPELFSDGKRWCSMTCAIFLHESIEEDDDISTLVVQVCEKYAQPHNRVVHLPLWLKNSFKQSGHEEVLQSRTWNWERFYQDVVFQNLDTIDPASRDALVLHAVDLDIQEIDNLLVCHPCIPTTGGHLQHIKKLVDPFGRVACLFDPEEERLLGGTINDFLSPRRILRLLKLGMASNNLPLEAITEKACKIPETWSVDREKAYLRLNCLLDLMKDHKDVDSAHWETLRTTEFLPAFLPGDIKMENGVTLKRPCDVFSDKCALLVNMAKCMLDQNNLKIPSNDPILACLGVCDSPSPLIVLQQLQEAFKQSQSKDNSMLHKIAFECYKFLDYSLRDSGKNNLISTNAKTFPFILLGNRFIDVNCVAENAQIEAKPYLHELPAAFANFKALWECVGVAKTFTVEQFLNVLQNLNSQHENKPLSKADISMCLHILNKGIFESKEKTTVDLTDCLIPNNKGVLQPACKLFYNDSPWIPVASGVTLCHENISRAMALHFGIVTTKHHTLESNIAESSPFEFPFEQREELVVRIKNLISAYPSKKDILKELIQNADDAEATEIVFVWDKRQHGKEKTFGNRWNHLQGPALCVFNNKAFSDADLDGIQQLGEGGKRNSPGKTGKYGVGFNSVYHLTDCPSILTGNKKLCISDPNQQYIESSSDKPQNGIGYNLTEEFKAMYMDVYNSFLPDKFSLKEGTMFRLPLRMGPMANSSQISPHKVTNQDMKDLCSLLSKDPEGFILFLRNICSIKVHEIDEDSKLKTIFEVKKKIPKTSKDGKDMFLKLRQKALQSNKQTLHREIYRTMILSSDKRESEWIVAEQFGVDGGDITLADKLPEAAIACLKPNHLHGANFKGEAFCSLPLPGKTGLPVHINANFEVDSSRRGIWKEDGPSPKTKWNDSLKEKVIAPLYGDLLHYISQNIPDQKVPAADVKVFFNDSFLCYWPHVTKDVPQEWHEFILEVYRSIQKRGLKVIPVMRRLTNTTYGLTFVNYTFDWCDVRETTPTHTPYLAHSTETEINGILEDLRMKLVPCSLKMQQVWKTFKTADLKIKVVSPSTVRSFLSKQPLNDPTTPSEALPLPIGSTLIRTRDRCSSLLGFCLQDLSCKKVKEIPLDGLPLLLTGDQVLRVFDSKSRKLISAHERLFIAESVHYMDQFADYSTNHWYKETLQEFNLVHNLTVPCAVKYLVPLIQHHLQRCEVDFDLGLHVPDQTMLTWLNLLWEFLTSQIETSSDALTFNDLKKLFKDCYILPVVCPRLNNKSLLQTMEAMPRVIKYDLDMDISGILFKLGFLRLDGTIFSSRTFQLLVPALMDVNDKSSVLDHIYAIGHSEFSQLSPAEMKELHNFLLSGASKAKNKRDYERKFKSLPLFETIYGQRVTIDEAKEAFILKSTHSIFFPDLFTLPNNHNYIFLKDSTENCALESLNMQIITDLEYFMKFILPVVQRLSETQLLNTLKLLLFLQHNLDYAQYEDSIITSLKTVDLICNSQGNLEKASYYFDESITLYKKFLPGERFVPETFWAEFDGGRKQKAENLLKALGMKHEVSNEDIVKFAQQLESEAKGNFEINDLKEKSKLLFSKALTQVEHDQNIKLLECIADISFLFPVTIKRELCNYHNAFADDRRAIKIRGSLIGRNDQELIWSSMPIIQLPGFFWNPELLKMLKEVGGHIQPPPKCVTTNMSNICEIPIETVDLIKTRARVFRKSYTYLQDHIFERQPLAGLPVVLVEKDTKLVKAANTSLVLDHDLEFRPYLYKIPVEYMSYPKFFEAIGVNQKPTAVQYCNVLASVYADTCDKPLLTANQLITVKRSVEQLFLLVEDEDGKSLNNVEKVYLPAVDGKLYPSDTLHYNDTAFEVNRFEVALGDRLLLLEKLSNCHLGSDTYRHHRMLKLLPPAFQPRMLSKVTEEKLVEEHMQRCEYVPDCEFSGWFERHLSSYAFRHGLVCLMRKESQGQTTYEAAAERYKETFGAINIVCCKNLETELWLEEEEEPLQSSVREIEVCVKRAQQGVTFYLKHNDNMADIKVITEVNMELTKEISVLLRIAPDHLQVLALLLVCNSLEDVQKTLSKNGIHDSAETPNLSLKLPAPGSDIPEEWYDCLDMSFLNNFEEGEYVGFSLNVHENKYIYAVIIKELPWTSERLSQKYKIDIGKGEEIEVGFLDLYQFKRERPKPKGTGTSARHHCMQLEPIVGAEPHYSQSSSSSARLSHVTLDQAKREIDECLDKIWSLPNNEREKAIKRMYLRWHPDKNPNCKALAEEAFKYLKERINRLQNNTRGSSHATNNFDFSNFFRDWNQEANSHRHGRERFFRGSRSNYNFWTHNEHVPRPNREEAQRWSKQARCDLRAADQDTRGGSTEWCLFKIHQAAEKSLIAAEYKRHGKHPGDIAILALAKKVAAYNVTLGLLPGIVQQLQKLGVDPKKTQYPNCHPFPHIPNGQFRAEHATKALEKASELLTLVEAYVN